MKTLALALATVVVIGLFITRPHLGTIYIGEVSGCSRCPWIRVPAPMLEYRSEADCLQSLKELALHLRDTDYRCRVENRLLWGW